MLPLIGFGVLRILFSIFNVSTILNGEIYHKDRRMGGRNVLQAFGMSYGTVE
jgi:hypothetical protein